MNEDGNIPPTIYDLEIKVFVFVNSDFSGYLALSRETLESHKTHDALCLWISEWSS